MAEALYIGPKAVRLIYYAVGACQGDLFTSEARLRGHGRGRGSILRLKEQSSVSLRRGREAQSKTV